MYNKEQKLRYIEESKERNFNLETQITNQFNKIASYEAELGRDLSNFSMPEIIFYFKTLSSSSFDYIMVINNMFLNYTKWCLANNLVEDCQNHYEYLTYDILKSCVNIGLAKAKIYSREEVLKVAENLNNPSDVVVLLCLFEGIAGENYDEIYFLEDNVDSNNILITYEGRKLQISDELKNYIRLSKETYEYYCFVGDTGEAKITGFKEEDHWVIKRYRNAVYAKEAAPADTRQQSIYSKLRRIRTDLNLSFSAKSLKESGRIDMIKNLLQNGHYDNLEDCISKNRKEIEYKYGKLPSIANYVLKYKDFY